MQLALIEFLSAGGDAGPDAHETDELRAQGLGMLRAVARQLSQFFTLRAPVSQTTASAIGDAAFPGQLDVVAGGDAISLQRQWLESASQCDVTLVIAPESDGILVHLLQLLGDAGVKLLNCDLEFTRCAADKLLTYQRLQHSRVPTPATLTTAQFRRDAPSGAWLRKPRFGCGSADIAAADSAVGSDDAIFQPFVLGAPTGCAVLASADGQYLALPPLIQKLRPGSFEYNGSDGTVPDHLDPTLRQLAIDAVRALPGRPRGYVGVDMIVAQEGPPVVLDINPRFTSSAAYLPPADQHRIASTYLELARASAAG